MMDERAVPAIAKASLAEEVSSSTMKLEAIKDITCAPEFGQISKWHGSTQISPSITDQLLMDADVAAPQQFLDAQVSYMLYLVHHLVFQRTIT